MIDVKSLDFKQSAITSADFEAMQEKTRFNGFIADYLLRYRAETGVVSNVPGQSRDAYFNRASRVRYCCSTLTYDYFRKQGIKYVTRVQTCRDKFCPGCASRAAMKRQEKYRPIIEELSSDYTLCHMVITIPNPDRSAFPDALRRMYKRFKYFTRILSGNKVVAGIGVDKWGYAGVLRSLEVTTCADETLHPHFHCVLALKKGLCLEGKHLNQYSFKRDSDEKRYFSDLEIFVQKLWYLVFNGIKVMKSSLDDLKLGYDCYIEPLSESNLHEIFKYTLKGLLAGDHFALDYEDFEVLETGLFGRHIIQGYGCFWQVKELASDSDFEIDEENAEAVEEILLKLREVERPQYWYGTLETALNETLLKKVTYFSKFNIHKLMASIREEESRQCKKKE